MWPPMRPPVDVVVPFRGEAPALEQILARLAGLHLGPGDSLVVVDNSPEERAVPGGVVRAPGLQTPGYARNRGVERGGAEWLLFIDADTLPPPDLLDRYFDPAPGERTAILAGGVRDEPVGPEAGPVARYSYVNGVMSQDNTFGYGPRWGFPQTANAMVRRAAFEEVGGFREGIRAGEDADLTYRLRDAGWEVERREEAAVVHLSRQSVWALARQRAGHGAAAAWLDREHGGGFPARRRPGLVWWGVRFAVSGVMSAARKRDRDAALLAVFDPLEQISYEFGRSLPNERPLPRRGPWRHLRG